MWQVVYMACGLEEVVVLIFSNSQNTFVEERQSLDGVLNVNQEVDTKLKNGLNDMNSKLDDISWPYLVGNILQK